MSLGDQPKRDTNYLLEDDDEESSHSPLIYVGLFLLLALAGGATWYWHTGAFPWQARVSSPSASVETSAPPVNSAIVPAPQENATSVQPVTPPAGVSPPAVPATPEGTGGNPAPPEKKDSVPAAAEQTPSPNASDKVGSADNTAASAAQTSTSVPNTPITEASPAPPPAAPKEVIEPKPRTIKPAEAKPKETVNPGDQLVSQGQKYLYGEGVPQDCDRAQKDLLTAAKQENSKAYTLLGSMYATGHCATRDLPTAYRWFARALHQDPANSRLQQNLEVIWRQMTPGERQVATRGE